MHSDAETFKSRPPAGSCNLLTVCRGWQTGCTDWDSASCGRCGEQRRRQWHLQVAESVIRQHQPSQLGQLLCGQCCVSVLVGTNTFKTHKLTDFGITGGWWLGHSNAIGLASQRPLGGYVEAFCWRTSVNGAEADATHPPDSALFARCGCCIAAARRGEAAWGSRLAVRWHYLKGLCCRIGSVAEAASLQCPGCATHTLIAQSDCGKARVRRRKTAPLWRPNFRWQRSCFLRETRAQSAYGFAPGKLVWWHPSPRLARQRQCRHRHTFKQRCFRAPYCMPCHSKALHHCAA